MINEYELLNKIGQGAYGTVFRAMHISTKLEFAIKVLKLDALRKKKVGARATEQRSDDIILKEVRSSARSGGARRYLGMCRRWR